jgi:hypothetical protein
MVTLTIYDLFRREVWVPVNSSSGLCRETALCRITHLLKELRRWVIVTPLNKGLCSNLRRIMRTCVAYFVSVRSQVRGHYCIRLAEGNHHELGTIKRYGAQMSLWSRNLHRPPILGRLEEVGRAMGNGLPKVQAEVLSLFIHRSEFWHGASIQSLGKEANTFSSPPC